LLSTHQCFISCNVSQNTEQSDSARGDVFTEEDYPSATETLKIIVSSWPQQQPTNQPFYRSTCISRHRQLKLEDFVGAKFYCLPALAGGNERIRIMEKMLEFS